MAFVVDDLDAVAARMKERGVEIIFGPHTIEAVKVKFFHVKDLNGYRLEFLQRTK
jgi:hypothetical protein